jgi:hypothetical protein
MRNLLLTLVIISGSLFFPYLIQAQGSFDCTWEPISGTCNPSQKTHACEPGYTPDPQICYVVTNPGTCGNSTVGTCVAPSYLCPNHKDVSTAIGCVPQGTVEAVTKILGWGMALAGGIAILIIIFSGIQYITASGDPKKLQAAQEMIGAALGALVLISLVVVLLNFIGVNILDLGGLGFNIK